MIKIGDPYIMIDKGDTFAGNWDQLADCFGIDEDTIEDWCRINKSTYSTKTYTAADELFNSLLKLSQHLKGPVPMTDEESGDYDSGIDDGQEYAARKIMLLLEQFQKDTY